MNDKLKSLLNDSSLFCYDLLDETMHDIPDIENKAPLVRYIEYKRNGNKYDPDSKSNILQEIYKLLWGELCSQWFMKKDNGMICSDNMTSAQNFVNSAMKKEAFLQKDKYKECRGNKQKYSTNFMIKVYDKDKEEKDKELTELFKSYGLDELVSVYHTIGNYCPVPRYFNKARAGYKSAVCDLWDLTLMKINEYYIVKGNPQQESRIFDELFHGQNNPLPCKAWLDYFGSWESFVDRNYFGSFVDDDYKVIPFWTGHGWDSKGFPDKKNELKDAVKAVKQRILLRGIKIGSKLRERLK